MSLLTLIQGVCNTPGIGINAPSVVVGSTDRGVKELYELAQQEGKELATRAAWQRLTKEQTFTSTATEAQANALATDADWIVPDTFYNRTQKRQVVGPLASKEWAAQKAITATVLFDSFRLRGNSILMLPTPAAGDTYAYEYVSLYWVDTDADGDGEAASWASDTDTALLDERLMKLGVVWRWKKAKGLDYAEDFRTYEILVTQAIGRDGARTKLDFSSEAGTDTPRSPAVPEGNWSL